MGQQIQVKLDMQLFECGHYIGLANGSTSSNRTFVGIYTSSCWI